MEEKNSSRKYDSHFRKKLVEKINSIKYITSKSKHEDTAYINLKYEKCCF